MKTIFMTFYIILIMNYWKKLFINKDKSNKIKEIKIGDI